MTTHGMHVVLDLGMVSRRPHNCACLPGECPCTSGECAECGPGCWAVVDEAGEIVSRYRGPDDPPRRFTGDPMYFASRREAEAFMENHNLDGGIFATKECKPTFRPQCQHGAALGECGLCDPNFHDAATPPKRRRRSFRTWCRCSPDSIATGNATYYDFRKGGPDYGKGPESRGHGYTCDRCGRIAQTG
jgi:hypothetical protein